MEVHAYLPSMEIILVWALVSKVAFWNFDPQGIPLLEFIFSPYWICIPIFVFQVPVRTFSFKNRILIQFKLQK